MFFFVHLTFLSSRKDWDDLLARFSLFRHRGQGLSAVVGRKWVFARAGAKDGAAHPDRRGGGFIFRVSVITHGKKLSRRFFWASCVMMVRVAHREGAGCSHISWRHGCAHARWEDEPRMRADDTPNTSWKQSEVLKISEISLPQKRWKIRTSPQKTISYCK